MTPKETADRLRQIATAIQASEKPRRELVASDLKKLVEALSAKPVSNG